jgi:hypothetical protein
MRLVERPFMTDLASRRSGHYEIVLFFHAPTGALTVSVLDEVTGVAHDLSVRPEEALDVFHHPFAHAARRRVPFPQLQPAPPAAWPTRSMQQPGEGEAA